MENILLNKFKVDSNKCTGCNACVDDYGNIFEIKDGSSIASAYTPCSASDFPDSDVAASCPMGAIALEKQYSGSASEIIVQEKKAKSTLTSKTGNTMGREILVLTRILQGKEEFHHGKVGQIHEKANLILTEINELMDKTDYTIEDLEKKDISLRQRYERANLLLKCIKKINDKDCFEAPKDAYRYFVEGKKRTSLMSGNNDR